MTRRERGEIVIRSSRLEPAKLTRKVLEVGEAQRGNLVEWRRDGRELIREFFIFGTEARVGVGDRERTFPSEVVVWSEVDSGRTSKTSGGWVVPYNPSEELALYLGVDSIARENVDFLTKVIASCGLDHGTFDNFEWDSSSAFNKFDFSLRYIRRRGKDGADFVIKRKPRWDLFRPDGRTLHPVVAQLEAKPPEQRAREFVHELEQRSSGKIKITGIPELNTT